MIRSFLSDVLLQPSLFHKFSYEQCVYLHEHLLHELNSIDFICVSVSLQVGVQLVFHHSNIWTVSFKALSLISLLCNRFLNTSCYRLLLLPNAIPYSMSLSQLLCSLPIHSFCLRLFSISAFIYRTFQRVCLKVFSSGIPKKKLSYECTDNHIGSFIHHLLQYIETSESLSKELDMQYTHLQEGDDQVL